MLWSEVRRWAKDNGYETIKDKDDGKYYWAKLDDNTPDSSGVVSSVSKLARAIYNHLTNNQWIEHQKIYQENLEIKKLTVSDYE